MRSRSRPVCECHTLSRGRCGHSITCRLSGSRKSFAHSALRYTAVIEMRDIESIKGDYVQGSYQLLSKAGDRVSAALFFARQCAQTAEVQNKQLARWYYRATLSEFKSIFDVLFSDMREYGVDKIWNRSQFKKQIENNPLIKVLKKARDLSIHTTKISGDHKSINVTFINENGESPKTIWCVFVNPIKKEMDKALSAITDEEAEWFNRQAQKWPAHLLIKEAIYQSSQQLAGFLSKYNEYLAV
jgi:hypothetical protein